MAPSLLHLFPLLRGWLLLPIPSVTELLHGFIVPTVLPLLRRELTRSLLPVTLELLLVGLELLSLLVELPDLLLELLLVGLELLNLLVELPLMRLKLRVLLPATLATTLLPMHSLSGETAALVKRLPLLVFAGCAARWASLRVLPAPCSWALLWP